MDTAQTKADLVEAFWQIYQTKPINKITVKDVTDAAGYYRSTLYYYFEDVYAILDYIEDTLLEEWEATIANGLVYGHEFLLHGNLSELLPLIKPFYTKNATYIAFLLGPSGDPQFMQKIKDTARTKLFSVLDIPETTLEAVLFFECCSSAMLHSFSKWYLENIPFETILTTVEKIINPTLFHTMISYSNNPNIRTFGNTL